MRARSGNRCLTPLVPSDEGEGTGGEDAVEEEDVSGGNRALRCRGQSLKKDLKV